MRKTIPKSKTWPRVSAFLGNERGLSTVEWTGLVVVAVVLFLAIVGFVRATGGEQIGQAVLDVFAEAIASLQGSGTPGSGEAPTGEVPDASLPAPILPSVGVSQLVANGAQPGEANPGETGDGGGLLEQVGGFFWGIGEGLVDTVTGIASLVWDGVRLAPITGDIYGFFDPEGRAEVQDRYANLWEAFTSDPLGTTGDLLYAMVEPIVMDWNEGRYGEAIGRGLFEIALFFVPGDELGKAGKVGVLARIDQMLPDELLGVLARADRLTPDELAAVLARLDRMTPEELADLLRRLDQMTPEEMARLGFNCSFAADTLVMTVWGLKAISEVIIGDYVLAYDTTSDTRTFYPVTDVWRHMDPTLVYLYLDGEVIVTTPEHPFFTAEKAWVPAGELAAGAQLWRGDEQVGQVRAVRQVQTPQTMYNLTVAEARTYYVGAGEWLVHNACRYALIYERLNRLTPDEFEAMIQRLDNLSPEELRALTNYRERWEAFFNRRPYLDEHGSYNIHHGFPREFREFFYERGIDIDNPGNMFELPESLHTRLPDGIHTGPYLESWNGRWQEWIRTHGSTATREDILRHLDQLAREFNIENYRGEAPRIAPPNVPPRLGN